MARWRGWPNLDAAARAWWSAAGRPIDLRGEHAWLDAATTDAGRVQDRWLQTEASRIGGSVSSDTAEAGLIPDLASLDSSTFRAEAVSPKIRNFYAHTAVWRMETWCQWSPLFAPAGVAIGALYGRRLDQLALPVHPIDVAYGMDSSVVPILGPDGNQRSAGWLRTLRSTGGYVFSGCYDVRWLPGRGARVHVTFPLELGNVQVFLQPVNGPDGSMRLVSRPGRFGHEGTYVVARHRGRHFAARVPLHEMFHLFTDSVGVLRTDHYLRFTRFNALRLHYKLTRQGPGTDPDQR